MTRRLFAVPVLQLLAFASTAPKQQGVSAAFVLPNPFTRKKPFALFDTEPSNEGDQWAFRNAQEQAKAWLPQENWAQADPLGNNGNNNVATQKIDCTPSNFAPGSPEEEQCAIDAALQAVNNGARNTGTGASPSSFPPLNGAATTVNNGNPPPFNGYNGLPTNGVAATANGSAPKATRGGVKGVTKGAREPYQFNIKKNKSPRSESVPESVNSAPDFFYASRAGGNTVQNSNQVPSDANGMNDYNINAMMNSNSAAANTNNQQQKQMETPFFMGNNRGPSTASIQGAQGGSSSSPQDKSEQVPEAPLTPPEWAKPVEEPQNNNPFTASSANDPAGQWQEPVESRPISKLDRMKNKAAVAALTYAIPVTAGTVFGVTQGPGILDGVNDAYQELAAIPWNAPVSQISSQNTMTSYMERMDLPWTDPRYAYPAAPVEQVQGRDQDQSMEQMGSAVASDNEAPSLYEEYMQQRMEQEQAGQAPQQQQDPVVSAPVQSADQNGGVTPEKQPTRSLYTEYMDNPNYQREPTPKPELASQTPSYADDTWNRLFSNDPRATQSTNNEARPSIPAGPSAADTMWERMQAGQQQRQPAVQPEAPSMPVERGASAADTMWERMQAGQQQQPTTQPEAPSMPVERGPSAADTMWERMQGGQQQQPTTQPEAPSMPVERGPSAADTMWERMQAQQQQSTTDSWTQTQPGYQGQQGNVAADSGPSMQPEHQGQPESVARDSSAWTQGQPEYQGQGESVAPDNSQLTQAQPKPQATPASYAEGTSAWEESQYGQQAPVIAAEAEMLAPVSWAASEGYFMPTNTSLF